MQTWVISVCPVRRTASIGGFRLYSSQDAGETIQKWFLWIWKIRLHCSAKGMAKTQTFLCLVWTPYYRKKPTFYASLPLTLAVVVSHFLCWLPKSQTRRRLCWKLRTSEPEVLLSLSKWKLFTRKSATQAMLHSLNPAAWFRNSEQIY